MIPNIFRVKSSGESDKRKVDKLERELNIANDKSEKAQRELITCEREKRKSDEDKSKFEANVAKLEGDMRMLTRYFYMNGIVGISYIPYCRTNLSITQIIADMVYLTKKI